MKVVCVKELIGFQRVLSSWWGEVFIGQWILDLVVLRTGEKFLFSEGFEAQSS